jgi:tRNA threonylcarbamoyladenosine biosynthesis protein TsaE
MELLAYQESDLTSIASEVVKQLGGRKIITLIGQMGAGKTTFIRYLAKEMGIQDEVSSPTYGYVNEYVSALFGSVYHFDLYRLETLEDAYNIGIEEYLYNDNICIIEWPEVIQELLGDDTFWIELEVAQNAKRIIRLNGLK